MRVPDTDVSSCRTVHTAEDTQTKTRTLTVGTDASSPPSTPSTPCTQAEKQQQSPLPQPGQEASWRRKPPVQLPPVAEKRTAAAQVGALTVVVLKPLLCTAEHTTEGEGSNL